MRPVRSRAAAGVAVTPSPSAAAAAPARGALLGLAAVLCSRSRSRRPSWRSTASALVHRVRPRGVAAVLAAATLCGAPLPAGTVAAPHGRRGRRRRRLPLLPRSRSSTPARRARDRRAAGNDIGRRGAEGGERLLARGARGRRRRDGVRDRRGGGGLSPADALLLVSVVICGIGYAEGGAVSRAGSRRDDLAALLSLPVTLVVAALPLPAAAPNASALFGFVYVGAARCSPASSLVRGSAQAASRGRAWLFQPLLTSVGARSCSARRSAGRWSWRASA